MEYTPTYLLRHTAGGNILTGAFPNLSSTVWSFLDIIGDFGNLNATHYFKGYLLRAWVSSNGVHWEWVMLFFYCLT